MYAQSHFRLPASLLRCSRMAVAGAMAAAPAASLSVAMTAVMTSAAHAQVLDMPTTQTAPAARTTQATQATYGEQLPRPATPTRGMSKNTVRARYGEPARRIGAVGDPPISKWIYDDFTVVFEYNLVLHAVVPKAPPPIYNADELAVAPASR